jgi:hypothetical protein
LLRFSRYIEQSSDAFKMAVLEAVDAVEAVEAVKESPYY